MAASTDFISYGNANVAALQVTAGLYPSASSTTSADGQVGIPLDIREKVQTKNIIYQSTPVGCKLYPGLKIFVEDTKEEITVIRKKEGAGYTGALWSDWEFDCILDEFKNAINTCRDTDPKFAPIKPGVYTLENLLNYLYLRDAPITHTYHSLTIIYRYGENGYIASGSSYEPVSTGEIASSAEDQLIEGQSWTWTVSSPRTGWYVSSYLQPTDHIDNIQQDETREYTIMRNEYLVSLSKDPSEGGSVWIGNGTETSDSFYFGDQCTVSARPNTNYVFTGWSRNGQIVNTSANYTFYVTGNTNLTAQFTYAPEGRIISVEANPAGFGTVTGGGVYNDNDTCTLTATPTSGREFTHWSKGGVSISQDAVYSFQVDSNSPGTYIANFKNIDYTISLSSSPINGGSVSGGGVIPNGNRCTAVATASQNFVFTNWTEGGSVVSENSSYEFTVNGDRTLVANFDVVDSKTINLVLQEDYNNECSAVLRNTTEGTSDESSSSEDIATLRFYEGNTCVLSSTAGSHYDFVKWKKGDNEYYTSEYTFTTTGTSTETWKAIFEPKSYQISATITPNNYGTVSGTGSIAYGTSCTLAATPNTGKTFVCWRLNNETYSTNANITFTVDGPKAFEAVFADAEYTISGVSDPEGRGSVDVNSTGTSSVSGLHYGDSVTLEATPGQGYRFVEWDDHTSVNPRTETVTGDKVYKATFEPSVYTISATADPSAGGTVEGTGTYANGSTCTLRAVPNAGYSVGVWTENGNIISVQSDGTYTFTVTANRSITVKFDVITNVDVYAWMHYDTNPLTLNNLQVSDVTSKPSVTVGSDRRNDIYGVESPGQSVSSDRQTGYLIAAIPSSFNHLAVTPQDQLYATAPFFMGNNGTAYQPVGVDQSRTMDINGTQYLIVESNALATSGTTQLLFGAVDTNQSFSTVWYHTSHQSGEDPSTPLTHIIDITQNNSSDN